MCAEVDAETMAAEVDVEAVAASAAVLIATADETALVATEDEAAGALQRVPLRWWTGAARTETRAKARRMSRVLKANMVA